MTETGFTLRKPRPQLYDDGAERALLGAMLLGSGPLKAAIGSVTSSDFYVPANATVFAALEHLHRHGHPVEAVGAVHELRRRGDLDGLPGGPAFLTELQASCPAPAAAPRYVALIQREAHKRRTIACLQSGIERAYADDLDGALDEVRTVTQLDTVEGVDASLLPVDLADVLDGSTVQPVPELLARDDGSGLFYAGAVNGLHGDSGTGKGWVVCQLIRDNARRGHRTMLLDFEDTADSIAARLLMLGMTPDEILRSLDYRRPQVQLGPAEVKLLCSHVTARRVAAVVIDSIGEAFALEGLNEDKDVEVGPWLRRVARELAETGAAVVLIDHATKAADTPLHPSGSKRKRAAITGASYLVEAAAPFVKGKGGRLRLTCAKDRHGNYRRGEHVADLVMGIDSRLELYAPVARTEEGSLPILLAARAAVAAAKAEGGSLSRNALEGLMRNTIKARAEVKRGGIDLATSRGALREERHGQARHYVFVRDLDDPSTPDLVPPRPTSSGTTSQDPTLDLVPSSHPKGGRGRGRDGDPGTTSPTSGGRDEVREGSA